MSRPRFALLALLAGLLSSGLATAGDKLALVVGVDRYREDQLPALDFADDDAIQLGDTLSQLGFDVVTMTPSAAKVSLHPDTPQDIRASLDLRLKACERDDIVIVSLSGHGLQIEGDTPRPDGTLETWFCPSKAQLDDRTTLLGISEVIERMARCQAASKLLLVDACRNDMKPPNRPKASDLVPRELDPAAPARRILPDGMVTLFSCSPRERSFELEALRHSVFSHHVIEYLSGKADDPARFYEHGEATLADFVTYVKKRTKQTVEKSLSRSQVPESVGRMTDWSFGKVGSDSTPPVPKPAGLAGRKPGELVVNSIGMKLVRIGEGEFLMGAEEEDNEKPIHRVRITKPFLLGQTEVTQAQFEHVTGTTPWQAKKCVKEGGNVAASYLSWNDAVAFCRKLTEIERRAGRLTGKRSYRLPTEAEWEYACRAGTKTRWSFGDDERLMSNHAWFSTNADRAGEEYAHEVGLKTPNPWGLHDMHGNVFEWCSDWYDENYYKTVEANSFAADPNGPSRGAGYRVLRGGSWLNYPVECRSASRDLGTPSFRIYYTGLRVVCELE